MELVRLKAENYDEWLHILNTVFSQHNGREMDFEKSLPKMCIKDDYHMGMHFGIKDEGKLVSVIGVYPLKVKIGDENITSATAGNVATLKEYEGRGYMRCLFEKAMEELEKIGADFSRLGGFRHRYNRYGYEAAGTLYKFSFNTQYTNALSGGKYAEFKKITKDDKKELEFINKLRQKEKMYVMRSDDDTYLGDYHTLCAWENTPYIAVYEGEMTGYISVSPDGKTIDDICATDLENFKRIIFGWQKKADMQISFSIPPFKYEEIKYFSSVSALLSTYSPCHFKIINFDKIANALIKLKKEYTFMAEGESVIEIEGWGNLLISNKDGNAFCEKTTKNASIKLDKITATRFLFGPFEPNYVSHCDAFLSSVLPLPLSWNTLDRV